MKNEALFLKRLSFLLLSGLSVKESIEFLVKQKELGLEKVIHDISEGKSFSRSLFEHGYIKDTLSKQLLKAGETTGDLADCVSYASLCLDKKKRLRQSILSALAYPALIFLGALVVMAGLLFFIFPKILPLLQSMNVPLPITTRILIDLFWSLTHPWTYILGICIFLSLSVFFYLRQKRLFIFILKVPVCGEVVRKYISARFCRVASTMLRSGTPLHAILLFSSEMFGELYNKIFFALSERIEEGSLLSEQLLLLPIFFPSVLAQLIAVGERSATLEQTFLYLADHYESEIAELSKRLSLLIEPVMMIALGLGIGFVGLSIITPIYSLSAYVGH